MPATANALSSSRKRKLLLRARAVLPISQPPISNAAILISGNRIAKVGRWLDFPRAERDETVDLGEVILLPGLINAHCHLDYTDMAGQFSPPKVFSDLLKLITTAQGHWSQPEYSRSWL